MFVTTPPRVLRRALRLSLIAGIVGAVAGLAGYGLVVAIALCGNLVFHGEWNTSISSVAGHQLGPWVILVPFMGGLVIGLMIHSAPEIRGTGIPETMRAVLQRAGCIAPRTAVFKPASIIVALGTGHPFGAEGAIVQTGGALGSAVGQWLPSSERERKILLACGAAGGMTGVFGTPLAAVILAIELLLPEHRSRSLVPLAIAVVAATSLRIGLSGFGPLFQLERVGFYLPGGLLLYAVLGAICGVSAVCIARTLASAERFVRRIRMPDLIKPALGGLALGVIGAAFPRALGIGYGEIEALLHGALSWETIVSILLMKSAALIIALASGTSGGAMGPLVVVGGALGALFGRAIEVFGTGLPSANAFALVGMAAVFGAAARVPLTMAIFVLEMTQVFTAAAPLLIGTVIASGVYDLLQRESILTASLARSGIDASRGAGFRPVTETRLRRR